jgi:hypothetical protein
MKSKDLESYRLIEKEKMTEQTKELDPLIMIYLKHLKEQLSYQRLLSKRSSTLEELLKP